MTFKIAINGPTQSTEPEYKCTWTADIDDENGKRCCEARVESSNENEGLLILMDQIKTHLQSKTKLTA